MAEGDFFSLLQDERHVRSWKFYLSPDLWDWINWGPMPPLISSFKASNGFIIVCTDKCTSGFGNGNLNTLFLNKGFRGRIGLITPKTDIGCIADNLDKIKLMFAEVTDAARASSGKSFVAPTLFPLDAVIVVTPPNFSSGIEADEECVKKRWMLKMTAKFYDWAAKKKNFSSQGGIKILFDPIGNRTRGKTVYNTQKKILLLDRGCKEKASKLPKACYEHINDILAALIEMSEVYEMIGPCPSTETGDQPEDRDDVGMSAGDMLSFFQSLVAHQ